MPVRHARAILACLAVAALGSAAGGQPRAASLPPGVVYVAQARPQAVARAVGAWAASVRRVMAGMDAAGMFGAADHPGGALYPGPYYLFVQQPGSTFLEEVRNTMEYELLKRGVPVARSPDGATVINLDIDAINWGSRVLGAESELLWRAAIFSDSRVLMKSTDLLRISDADTALYQGSTTLAPLASPGVVRLGAARPLHYAR